MNAEDLEIGALYHVGAACGVPHGERPINFLLDAVLNPTDSYHYEGYAWLKGEEVGYHADSGRYVPRQTHVVRQIYVITAGLRLLHSPREEALAEARRRRRTARALQLLQRNDGLVIPRQRTPSDTTTGRPR